MVTLVIHHLTVSYGTDIIPRGPPRQLIIWTEFVGGRREVNKKITNACSNVIPGLGQQYLKWMRTFQTAKHKVVRMEI